MFPRKAAAHFSRPFLAAPPQLSQETATCWLAARGVDHGNDHSNDHKCAFRQKYSVYYSEEFLILCGPL